MTNTKANNEQHTGGLPRRGFFGAIAASVAGAVGLGHLVAPSAAASTEKPLITTHPNAVARTEEGSRRHG